MYNSTAMGCQYRFNNNTRLQSDTPFAESDRAVGESSIPNEKVSVQDILWQTKYLAFPFEMCSVVCYRYSVVILNKALLELFRTSVPRWSLLADKNKLCKLSRKY